MSEDESACMQGFGAACPGNSWQQEDLEDKNTLNEEAHV